VDFSLYQFDAQGRDRFFIRLITDELQEGRDGTWLWAEKPSFVGSKLGCCSTRPVAFHYVKVSHGKGWYFAWANYFMVDVQNDPLI